MSDHITQINNWLRDCALYPAYEAVAIVGCPQLWLLEDQHECMAYTSPEGCYRALCLLDQEIATRDAILCALHPNRVSDDVEQQIELQPDGGYLWVG